MMNSVFSFDSYNGEAFYNDKMDEVVDILTEKGLLQESQGAQVVNLENTVSNTQPSSKIRWCDTLHHT